MWTKERLHSFIVSSLRNGYRKYPPKYETLHEAFTGKKININSKRMAAHYKCASCNEDFPAKSVQVDHIDPVVDPKTGFISWDVLISRLFCEKENLQVLCTECHNTKTREERKLRSIK